MFLEFDGKRGHESKKEQRLVFEAGADLCHEQRVMFDQSDKCKVIPWDNVDECDVIGYVYCPIAKGDRKVKAGDCVDIHIAKQYGCKGGGTTTGGPMAADWALDADCNKVFWILNPNGTYTYLDGPGGSPVVPVLPLCPFDPNAKTDEDFIEEVLCLVADDTTPVGLADASITFGGMPIGVIPPDAVGAYIQVDTSDMGCLNFFADGRVPTSAQGYSLGDGGIVKLGCTSTDTSQGDIAELDNFLALSEPGVTTKLTITLYRKG